LGISAAGFFDMAGDSKSAGAIGNRIADFPLAGKCC
jgi:hypothetical protein